MGPWLPRSCHRNPGVEAGRKGCQSLFSARRWVLEAQPQPRRGSAGVRTICWAGRPSGAASAPSSPGTRAPGGGRGTVPSPQGGRAPAHLAEPQPLRSRRRLGVTSPPGPAPEAASLTAAAAAAAAQVALPPQPAEPGPSAGAAAPPGGRPSPARPALRGGGAGGRAGARAARRPRDPSPLAPQPPPRAPPAPPRTQTRAGSRAPPRARPSPHRTAPHRTPHAPLQRRFVFPLPRIGMSSHLPSAIAGCLSPASLNFPNSRTPPPVSPHPVPPPRPPSPIFALPLPAALLTPTGQKLFFHRNRQIFIEHLLCLDTGGGVSDNGCHLQSNNNKSLSLLGRPETGVPQVAQLMVVGLGLETRFLASSLGPFQGKLQDAPDQLGEPDTTYEMRNRIPIPPGCESCLRKYGNVRQPVLSKSAVADILNEEDT